VHHLEVTFQILPLDYFGYRQSPPDWHQLSDLICMPPGIPGTYGHGSIYVGYWE